MGRKRPAKAGPRRRQQTKSADSAGAPTPHALAGAHKAPARRGRASRVECARAAVVAPTDEFTAKERRFVEEYLVDLNATQAALRAGYSARSARAQGGELLQRPKVAAAIAAAQSARAARTQLAADEVLRNLAPLIRSNVEHYRISDDGHLGLAPGAPEDALLAVASVKRRVTTGEDGCVTQDVEFRLWPKVGALELGMRHLGMLPRDGAPAIQVNQFLLLAARQAQALPDDELRRLAAASDEELVAYLANQEVA